MPKKFKNKKERRAYNKEKNRKYRLAHPISASYSDLKNRARQRKKTCGITLAEFTEWCMETNYHILKGPGAYDMTIDRDDNDIGYEKGNLVMRHRVDNALKERCRQLGREFEPMPPLEIDPWTPATDIESF